MSALLELIVVMTLIGLLVGIALPAYRDATQRAREATLKEDLTRMRTAIDEYLRRHPLLQLLESAQGAALSGCSPGSAVVRVLRPTSVARRGGFRFGMTPTGPGSRASVPRARVVYLRDSRLRPGRC